jgi:hypothetical protein
MEPKFGNLKQLHQMAMFIPEAKMQSNSKKKIRQCEKVQSAAHVEL